MDAKPVLQRAYRHLPITSVRITESLQNFLGGGTQTCIKHSPISHTQNRLTATIILISAVQSFVQMVNALQFNWFVLLQEMPAHELTLVSFYLLKP